MNNPLSAREWILEPQLNIYGLVLQFELECQEPEDEEESWMCTCK